MNNLLHNRVAAVSAGALVIIGVGAAGAAADKLIDSGDIRDDSIRSIDIRDDGLRSVDYGDRSVKSEDLDFGSVLKEHIAADSVGLNELNQTAIDNLSDAPTMLTTGDLGPFTSANTYCGGGANTGSQGPVNSTSKTPPLGTGSYRLAVGTDGDSLTSLAVDDAVDVALGDLELRYSTFVDEPSNSPDQDQSPFVIVDVDLDGDGARDDQIFFEPTYQDGNFAGSLDQGEVEVGQWQTWNATLGNAAWWHFDGQGAVEYTTLGDYLAANPGASITRLRLSVGCGGATWAGFAGNVDAVELNGEVFDFERY